MGDIDLLVPEADLGKARKILFQQGYEQVAEVSYAEIQTEVEIAHHLAPFVKQGSPTIELHWHIVKPGEGHFVFLAEELWRELGHATLLAETPWPEPEPALLLDETVTVAIQVGGKLRATLSLARDLAEGELRLAVLAEEKVQRALDGRAIRKMIVVPNRVVNLVV